MVYIIGRSISARLLASYICLIALLGVTWLASVFSASTLRASYVHTATTIDGLTHAALQLSKLRDDEETGLRGYLLTGQRDFLRPLISRRRCSRCKA